jgi:hypothetical protein
MRMVDGVKAFKITHKFVKAASREVFYVGFPCTSIDSVSSLFQNDGWQLANDEVPNPGKTLVFFSEMPRNDDYESWCQVVLQRESAKADKPDKKNAMAIQAQIEAFSMENATPMEAFLFLNGLKQQIRNGYLRCARV